MRPETALAVAAVRQLPGVSSVEADDDGDGLSALRVRLSAGADPARVGAAVLRVAQASSGSPLDPAQVRVVGDDAPPTAVEAADRLASVNGADPRPQVLRTEVEVRASDVSTTVVLTAGERTATGRCTGSLAGSGVPRAVAGATLRALEGLLRGSATLELDAVRIHRGDGEAVVLVRLTLQVGHVEQQLTGSAAVRAEQSDAVVRAVLDASNRRLASLL